MDDNDGFVITTKVNYSNNKELVNQKIYVDNDLFIKKVEVMDDNNIIKLKMDINNIDYNSNFDDNYFNLDNNMTVSLELDDGSVVSSLNDVIYPMYIPDNTYLKTQDKVSKEDGERIIMTFVGDHPFMLIQETLSNSIKNEIISVSGEPFITSGVIGIMDDSSLTWINNGVEYYLVSNSLDNYELSEVANSLTVAAITK